MLIWQLLVTVYYTHLNWSRIYRKEKQSYGGGHINHCSNGGIIDTTESLIQSNLLVYSSDTDVYFLLINHCNRFQCKNIYQQLVSGFVKINDIVHILGGLCSTAILVFHGITGCDTVGRFSGKSKEFWFRRFMSFERQNQELVQALVDFGNSTTENSFKEIEGFICSGYLFPRSKAKIKQNGVYDIKTTCYKRFAQKK